MNALCHVLNVQCQALEIFESLYAVRTVDNVGRHATAFEHVRVACDGVHGSKHRVAAFCQLFHDPAQDLKWDKWTTLG